MKIKELDKPGLVHCQHLNLSEAVKENTMQLSSDACVRCSIYADRPKVCRDYACMWVAGYGAEADRPDRSLMLIDTVHRIGNAVECKPLAEGADETPRGKNAIRRISREARKVALVTTFRETRLTRVVGRPD